MSVRLLGLLLLLGAVLAACGPQAASEVARATTSPSPATATAARTPEATATVTPAPATPTSTPAAGAGGIGQVGAAPRDVLRIQALPRALGDRTRLVVVDPGHAEDEVGAAANGVVEKHSNLDMAMRVEALLQQQGVRVVLTRRADERTYAPGTVIQGNSATRRDLQARIDLANDLNADFFVSLHSNGAASTAERGVEVYWDSGRPFAALNQQLATSIQAAVVGEMAAAGMPVTDRGAKDDACLRFFRGRCFPLFVLGPGRSTTGEEIIQRGGSPAELGLAPGQTSVTSRATQMPGALVELLFISSPEDAALLRSEDARDAMARGVARGIIEQLNRTPPR
ncbi:MAG: N-acetylmuramoyl-L-alanine amidase [Dehalococcoidia bacterium]